MADALRAEIVPANPPLAKLIPEIVDRFRNGEPLADIAAELNRHPSTLYKAILKRKGAEAYAEAKAEAFQVRIYDADVKLDEAKNMLEFNKAHARAKLVRQDYERCCPDEYGPKQEMSGEMNWNIIVKRDRVEPLVTPPVVVNDSHNMTSPVSVQELKDK